MPYLVAFKTYLYVYLYSDGAPIPIYLPVYIVFVLFIWCMWKRKQTLS